MRRLEVVFGAAGTFGYHCDIHTSMQGTVVVETGGLPEAVVAIELANAFLEKFGGDSVTEIKRNYDGYMKYLQEF